MKIYLLCVFCLIMNACSSVDSSTDKSFDPEKKYENFQIALRKSIAEIPKGSNESEIQSVFTKNIKIDEIIYTRSEVNFESNDYLNLTDFFADAIKQNYLSKSVATYMTKISANIVCGEHSDILLQISSDAELSSDEKDFLIYFLASSDLLSQRVAQFQLLNTRVTRSECDNAYMTSLNRIVRNYAISGGVSIFTGPIGLGVSTIIAYIALNEAENDYNACLSKI